MRWNIFIQSERIIEIGPHCQRYRKNKSGTFLWPTVYLQIYFSGKSWRINHLNLHLRNYESFCFIRSVMHRSEKFWVSCMWLIKNLVNYLGSCWWCILAHSVLHASLYIDTHSQSVGCRGQGDAKQKHNVYICILRRSVGYRRPGRTAILPPRKVVRCLMPLTS